MISPMLTRVGSPTTVPWPHNQSVLGSTYQYHYQATNSPPTKLCIDSWGPQVSRLPWGFSLLDSRHVYRIELPRAVVGSVSLPS